MKNKWGFVVMVLFVIAISVANAARTRRNVPVVDDTVVSPLDGYAGQVD